MQWALVNTVQMNVIVGTWNTASPPQYSEQTISSAPGTIINFIVYNGTDSYTPPEGMKLEQVPDTAKIGDTGY